MHTDGRTNGRMDGQMDRQKGNDLKHAQTQSNVALAPGCSLFGIRNHTHTETNTALRYRGL